MLRPNPQIELHPAWHWTCDECGERNFEVSVVKSVISSEERDALEQYADDVDGMDSIDDDDIDVNFDGGIEDESDDDDDDDDDMLIELVPVVHLTLPRQLRCGKCGATYDDIVVQSL